jgi:predicted anti-sigma-YlaC factor YlaD
MNGSCQFFIDRLEGFLDGNLDSAGRRAVEEHLLDCARCRELAEMFRQDREGLAVEPPPDLAEAILRTTSGATCASAHPRLCDHADGLLGEVDRELVGAHLDSCPDCAGLARALARLATELPQLAEFEADEPLVQAVLDRTSRLRPRADRRTDWIRERWRDLLARPRLAWEASYVATFVLALLFLMPWSPLSAPAQGALAALRGGDAAGMENPLGGVGERLAHGVPRAWEASGGRLITALNQVPAGIGRLGEGAREGIQRGVGTLSMRDTSGQESTETNGSPAGDRIEGDEP